MIYKLLFAVACVAGSADAYTPSRQTVQMKTGIVRLFIFYQLK